MHGYIPTVFSKKTNKVEGRQGNAFMSLPIDDTLAFLIAKKYVWSELG